uniref:Uncharacterized protein n=1 Tax=Tanacetum cinerariifolium TaxID=118510 RepID=A0A699I7U9_TANCI|nr:hypothetical protein [Tanacetum cinerariifolium]
MVDEEVPMIDGVFEGALGALALEMEALVDAMEFGKSDGGGGELGGEGWERICSIMSLHVPQEGSKEWDDQRYVKKSMEDEEVPMIDDVFEGVLGALEALEMEALVDAMEVYGG